MFKMDIDFNDANGRTEARDTKLLGPTDEKAVAKAKEHLEACIKEKQKLSSTVFPIAARLLSEEIQRTQDTGKASFDYRYIDLCHGKPTKIIEKVLVPQQDAPHFNYIGKVLGPKGNTLKALSDASKCRIYILGKGSVRDKTKEEEYRNSLDPKYAHLSEELHVEVSCVAPAELAHERVAYALKELRVLLVPDPPAGMESYQYPIMGPSPVAPPMLAATPPDMRSNLNISGKKKKRPPMESGYASPAALTPSPMAPPRSRFPPPGGAAGWTNRFPPPAQYDYDDGDYEEYQWRPQFKAPTPRFYPPRTTPYGRP